MNLKRSFDVSAAALSLTLLSPVLAVVALAGLARFGGNPLYGVERVGKDGKVFRMLKFKTMEDFRDADGALLPDEERGTPFGKFLRATALDELPQLVNIIKGEMSFVGPRPHSPGEIPAAGPTPDHQDILSVRPGLTGPWQVAAIGSKTALPQEDRLRLDASYARNNPSLGGDLVLIWKTVPALVRGHDGESLSRPQPRPGPGQNPP